MKNVQGILFELQPFCQAHCDQISENPLFNVTFDKLYPRLHPPAGLRPIETITEDRALCLQSRHTINASVCRFRVPEIISRSLPK